MSKTPRQAFLSNFWVGTKGGLLTAKHIRKMGMARWLFDYLTRGQTGIKNDLGLFQWGHAITLEQIAFDLREGEDEVPVRTIRRWISRLRREGYIETECHSNQGISFRICKPKIKTLKQKITKERAEGILNIRPQMAASSENIRPHFVMESSQPPENAEPARAIPKESYYKKESGAQTAPSPPPSMKELERKTQPPREMSRAELDARRRELLQQAERIKREHPPREQPGKVLEMPREATA